MTLLLLPANCTGRWRPVFSRYFITGRYSGIIPGTGRIAPAADAPVFFCRCPVFPGTLPVLLVLNYSTNLIGLGLGFFRLSIEESTLRPSGRANKKRTFLLEANGFFRELQREIRENNEKTNSS
jgi:hypothetical protein